MDVLNIRKMNGDGPMLAAATLKLPLTEPADAHLYVDVAYIKGKNGPFLSFPSRKSNDGKSYFTNVRADAKAFYDDALAAVTAAVNASEANQQVSQESNTPPTE